MPVCTTHIRCSIVVGISACHAEDPGSIPGGGMYCAVCGDGLCSLSLNADLLLIMWPLRTRLAACTSHTCHYGRMSHKAACGRGSPPRFCAFSVPCLFVWLFVCLCVCACVASGPTNRFSSLTLESQERAQDFVHKRSQDRRSRRDRKPAMAMPTCTPCLAVAARGSSCRSWREDLVC